MGCAKVSPACAHCYAEELMDKRYGKVKWGAGQPRVRTSEANWKLPLRWNREAENTGVRTRVFCASLADWLDDDGVPIEWLADLLALIKDTPHLDWLQLSKRPENFFARLKAVDALLSNGYIPFNETSATRAKGVPTGEVRRIGDRQYGEDLAALKAGGRPMEWRHKKGMLQKGESGDDERTRLFAGQINAKQCEISFSGASAGVDSFQRANTAGSYDQSQERQQAGQSPGEPGVGDLQSAAASCDSGVEREASRHSRRETPKDEAQRQRCDGNEEAQSRRGEREENSNKILHETKGSQLHHHRKDVEAFASWIRAWINGSPPANIWIGATVENQEYADKRIPALLSIPARVRFLSCEPLLGAVDLTFPGGAQIDTPYYLRGNFWEVACENHCSFVGRESELNRDGEEDRCPKCNSDVLVYRRGDDPCIHWVIAGGESGKHARPSHPDWFRSLRDQCVAAGVAFHFKQWGEWVPAVESHGITGSSMPENGIMPCGKSAQWIGIDGRVAYPSAHGLNDAFAVARVGKRAAGRLLDGREWNEFPGSLQKTK